MVSNARLDVPNVGQNRVTVSRAMLGGDIHGDGAGKGMRRHVDFKEMVCMAGIEEIAKEVDLGDGGPGDVGGSGGEPPVPKRTGEEDDGEGREVLMDALIKAGATLKDLPKDMQAAIQMAALTVDDIHRFLAISAVPILGNLCRAFPAFRDRVMGNPRFILQVCLELGLGATAKTIAEYKARGDKFYEETPFVLSDLALEILGDFSLVWLLSPKTSFRVTKDAGLAAVISKLPGHCLQAGPYTLPQRAMTIAYRGAQFFCVGFATSVVGHSITKAAVQAGLEAEDDVELAPVLDNSIGWGSFMLLSSNLRYQTVNCIEERVLDAFVPTKLINIPLTFGLRFTNCFLGGVQWVWFAQKVGLQ